MKKIFWIIPALVILTGCSKMEEKKSGTDTKPPMQQPGTSDNTGSQQSGKTDEKATELTKEADEALTKYGSDKSDANKKEVVTKCMAAGNYLMFEANLPAKEKYRPALKYYRQVLAVDPGNEEASKNKKQIEDIYEQMGMPIPQ